IDHPERRFDITLHACCDDHIFVHLCRIDVDLKDPCVPCKFLCISRHTVTETGAEHDQKITLADPEIRCLGAVHSEHPGIARICPRECALAHQRICDRSIQLIHELEQFFARPRENGAAADKDKR